MTRFAAPRPAHDLSACTRCGACARRCAFLRARGLPGDIADAVATGRLSPAVAYECSLCGLCGAVCPEGLRPEAAFLGMRRMAAGQGLLDEGRYRPLLAYEARGGSSLYALYRLPAGCHTVFFPGCSLPGARPRTVEAVYRHLAQRMPGLGLVLDCCRKPSHDLGLQERFREGLGRVLDRLRGVRQVLVSCPNCLRVFREYGQGLAVRTVYEALLEVGPPPPRGPVPDTAVVVHDPCVLRRETAVLAATRGLLAHLGLRAAEPRHAGERTLCCGEGGGVGLVRPEFAAAWKRRRLEDVAGRVLVSTCAGCLRSLDGGAPVAHLLDVLLEPAEALAGNCPPARPPFTCLGRLRLKLRLR